MKREALVPIDAELERDIAEQQARARGRWPDCPLLLPRPTANLDGSKPVSSSTYRQALYRWLQRCDIRDEHGRPAHLTPHQCRHTLGTRLINRDVPQEVVRRILDHDSHAMTAHYARLSDTTIRRHWEQARKVGATGEEVTLDPDGPLADAAWAKQRLGRATQALPNGYCGLPAQKTCPHANACLTCPMFITTVEFLPQHRAQHRQTLQIISAAEARGQQRLAEMNRQVAGNLEKIITALQGDTPRDEVADAS
jgi:Phage integrase family